MIILKNWNELKNIYQTLNYDDYEPLFSNRIKLELNYLKNEIFKENTYNII